MKPKLGVVTKYKKLLKNTKNHSFSSLFKVINSNNDPISKFLTSHNILQDKKDAEKKELKNTKINFLKKNSSKITSSERASPLNSKEVSKHDNIIISNSFFNSNYNNKKPKNKNITKYNNLSNEKKINFPLAIVELNDFESEKKDKIFLTQSVKKKKKININLKEEEKNDIVSFRNNKIIYNFYTDYMRRQKQKELIDSKLFKQKLISAFFKYSPNYMRRVAQKTEQKYHKEKEVLEKMKSENNIKKYNYFKSIITKRLTEGNADSEKENSNLFINSIYNFLYKNIMSYDSLINLLNKFKGKIPLAFAKMISEFLSLRFDCFRKIKNEYGAQYKMIKLCDLLKLEKFKKGEIIYDIDNYEKNYYLLLKGNIDVYQIFFVSEKMQIKKFINYLKDIKDNDNIFKFYRILQKNIMERTYDKFDIIEKILNDETIGKKYDINLSDEGVFYIEEIRSVGTRGPGENVNNEYNDYKTSKVPFNNKNGSLLRKSTPNFIKDFFTVRENRIYYKKNYSDKKYECIEDCILLSIEKDVYEKKLQDMDMKLFGENNDMFLLYIFIFKNWEKEYITSIIKNYFQRKILSSGEYLYQQNDISDKIYIVIRGEFSQSMSLNSKRMNEVKNYISFNKNNIFTIWKNKPKKSINKEEIEKFFEKEEKTNGDFPFEMKDKKPSIGKKNIFNIKYYLKKKKEENEKNDLQDIKLKNRFRYEVLGMEDAIEGKHRFVSTKCESKKGEILEIKIVDFFNFCFHRNIQINNLREIISNLKDILIQKIEKIILVNQNNLIKNNNYPIDLNDDNESENNKKFHLKIHKKIYRKNYFEENKLIDPLEIAILNMRRFHRKKLKEKYEVKISKTANVTYTNKVYDNNYKDLFYDYIGNKSKINDYNDTNNVNNNENTIETNIVETNKKSANDFKKLVLDNIKIYSNIHSVRKNKNKKMNEREEIRKRYLRAKKKLEESYFNREKIYYMKNFKNFPFVNYIYQNNKKGNNNIEESLSNRLNKDLKKQKKFENFLKMLNSGKEKNKILFSKSVLREAGYFSKNNSYKKIQERNNNKGKSKLNSFCKTDYRKGNDKYDLDVCFLKYIDFSKNNDPNNSYFKNIKNK